MHKIYLDEGSFNFLYQLPQIIIASLISGIIGILIKYLALSQENISKFKQTKEQKNLDKDFSELLRTLKNKFISFFIITFLLLVFFLVLYFLLLWGICKYPRASFKRYNF